MGLEICLYLYMGMYLQSLVIYYYLFCLAMLTNQIIGSAYTGQRIKDRSDATKS